MSLQETTPCSLRMTSPTPILLVEPYWKLILSFLMQWTSLYFSSTVHVGNADLFILPQVDGSVVTKQGIRFVFTDGSRIIFRLSVGATFDISFQFLFSFSFFRTNIIKCRVPGLLVQLFAYILNNLNRMSLNTAWMHKQL